MMVNRWVPHTPFMLVGHVEPEAANLTLYLQAPVVLSVKVNDPPKRYSTWYPEPVFMLVICPAV